jgi:hypothetical protein
MHQLKGIVMGIQISLAHFVLSVLLLGCGSSLKKNQNIDRIERVVILDIINKAQMDSQQLDYLTETMREAVTKLPRDRYSIMTKDNIQVLLPPKTTLQDCIGSCVVDTGRRLGAHWLVHSEVYRFGQLFRVIAKLHHTKSGEVRASKKLKLIHLKSLSLKCKIFRCPYSVVWMRMLKT